MPGKTGVWVGERKIAAVGVRISHGIASHGLALNVSTRLDAYAHIVPCGTPDKEVTSMERQLGRAVALPLVACALGDAFAACFGYERVDALPDVGAMLSAAGLAAASP